LTEGRLSARASPGLSRTVIPDLNK
jgi:hypothetical protein